MSPAQALGFEARERRFERRLEAVVAFDVAVTTATMPPSTGVKSTDREDGEVSDNGSGVLETSYARALVLGTPGVVPAAENRYQATPYGDHR